MIKWMQRHKKWLIVTIWISTIAFVGAGFVGWGSYDYSKKNGTVAVINGKDISVSELQTVYSNLYQQYASVLGDKFNKEQAKKIGLENIAYSKLLQESLLLAYADKIGLDVTEEELGNNIRNQKAFQKNGVFSKEIYLKVLNLNRFTIEKYETMIKREMLLGKISQIFKTNPTNIEIENLNKLYFLEDDIEYKILYAKNYFVNATDKEVKKYWEKNKKNYMSPTTYTLNYKKIPVIKSFHSEEEVKSAYERNKLNYRKNDGKLKSMSESLDEINIYLDKKDSKKNANKEYIAIKHNKEKANIAKTFNALELPFENNNKLITQAKAGKLLKPFYYNKNFYVVKIEKITLPKPLVFNLAKNDAKIDYINNKKIELLNKDAKNKLNNFKGTLVKSTSRESVEKIKDLDITLAANFLAKVFASSNKEGIINFNDKVVLYKVIASKMGKHDDSKNMMIKNTLMQLKDNTVISNLLKKLEKTYKIETYYDTAKNAQQ